MKGRVESFDEVRGFGYIQQEGGTTEIFVDATDIKGRKPSVGDEVEYQVKHSPRGPNAVNVVVLTSFGRSQRKPVQSVRLHQQAATENKKGRESGSSRKLRSFSEAKSSANPQPERQCQR